ncbi:MAG: YifB family Mg chelatase-like AAA ATPase [Deltaproteobacteria bacterium]|nr:YifB family Mg chelatase-like AAA ATPase [Deltaproteobacteria bacterium]
MQQTVLSATLRGVDALAVEVEVDLGTGLPSVTIVGLAEAAVRESRLRVQAAIAATGLVFPVARITVNLAPAHVKKDGTGFDLPIALAILAAHGALPAAALAEVLVLGELSLAGDVRPVRGAIAAAEAARAARRRTVLVAPENAPEAALVQDVEVRAVRTLGDAVAYLGAGQHERAPVVSEGAVAQPRANEPDLRDVKGQAFARRALEVAAAGGHNLLFYGGPGAGKTMLARRLPGILPGLSHGEALEVTRVHSVAGLNIGGGLVAHRPFRAPHHSTTPPGLVGGGNPLRPGEVSLAHHGVLFLDELPEFARATLEVLREPLEGGEVVLSRATGTLRYPARCLLVASMNPCPCGRHGSARCRCLAGDVRRYQGRVSGPLLDRIDLHVAVPPVDLAALDDEAAGEPSDAVALRVARARERQRSRGAPASRLAAAALEETARPDAEGRKLLLRAVDKLGLSARGYDRVRRVARTIADLAGVERVAAVHVAEALQYRATVEGAHPPGHDAARQPPHPTAL